MQKRSTPRSNHGDRTVASRPSGTGWMVVGGSLAFVGVALAAQKFLPAPVGDVLGAAREYGFEAGVLFVGGLCVAAVGSAARALGKRAAQPNDDALLLEQIANDLLIAKDGLEQAKQSTDGVQNDVGLLQAHVQSLGELVHALPQQLAAQQPQAAPQGNGSEDAIFRLAASLDQLGARMEQRMKAQYGQMQSSLDELNGVVASVRRNVDELFQGASGAEPVARAVATPTHEHAQMPAAHAAPTAPAAPLPAYDTPTNSVPLGLLDQLDDPRIDAPAPRVAEAQPANAYAHTGAQLGQTGVRPVPLSATGIRPVPLSATGIRPVPATPAQPANAVEDDSDQKLAALRSLLSDERLRETLDQMRRTS
ncbi:MAG: hypothetical protein L6Q99_10270 [Planctomycetes bacterium]|nr:hypothetical protein [Planctomycetota bacterium]